MHARKRRISQATTAEVRRWIQASDDSVAALARRFQINEKTVRKWRRRDHTTDAPRGRPGKKHSSVLTAEEEAIIVGWRSSTMLPLDDCLHALRIWIPKLTRASMHRCLTRHGVGRLPGGTRFAVKAEPQRIGVFRLAIGVTATAEGECYVFSAVDLASRVFFARAYGKTNKTTAREFLHSLIAAMPFRVCAVITEDMAPFTDGRGASALAEADHRLTPPDARWAGLQRERLARWTLKGPYQNNAQLQKALTQFMNSYHDRARLLSLNGATPRQFIEHAYAARPDLFVRRPGGGPPPSG